MARRMPALRGVAILLALCAALFWVFGGSGSPRATPVAVRAVTRVQILGFLTETEPHHAPVRVSRARRPVVPPAVFVGRDGARITPGRLQAYLRRHGSPMAWHAEAFVRSGMAYGVDPRVVAAIAGVESSFGIYRRGFNAWGFGRYRWSSWNESIAEFTRHVAQSYPGMRYGDFGAVARRYDPPNPIGWAARCVRYFEAI